MRKKDGFTIIEMLAVTAIIGILAALLIPQIYTAIQKAKQKGTMQDMNGIARAIVDYITDKGCAPEQSGPIVSGSTFIQKIQPFYSKVIPLVDQWGTSFYVYCGTAVTAAGIAGVSASGQDDFIVISYARDGVSDSFSFDPLDPGKSYFEITSLASFNQDLIIWNGAWIHGPRSSKVGEP